MPHADSAVIPSGIDKAAFWVHVHEQLSHLLAGQRDWVTNLANASSLIFNALQAFPDFGTGDGMVNWCGFYLHSDLFPAPRLSPQTQKPANQSARLLLGPFCGKPACQFINVSPEKARGVCADAYLQRLTVLVTDVNEYPGHIACDGETKSEIVCPLLLSLPGEESERALGVLDLDCLALAGFDERDKTGLERIAKLVVEACDW
ncbi:GAF domain nucleotide-binding protein [Dichomitus squalens]|uniref:GAF domain nucleotide-binding protein n=1 Tax=Dichomitus squalens TaxID=114155 RepID=A0A4Q9P3H0_9APHY|nr:GAF domain nucleotide-binding protein [Dichomitus squalens]TBU48135.1 GAF domain nucleotide-binding protein [Dichomitus squalens]TBU64423.1 GAF domain nucleotide-binding protein [Dichomitus squalens]